MHRYFKGLTAAERIAFVKRYPFSQEAVPFLFVEGRVLRLASYSLADLREAVAETLEGPRPVAAVLRPELLARLHPRIKRHPVLSSGSNGSPEQLVRKFHAYTDSPLIFPVVRGMLDGFASVYVAALSDYAAVPAMLAPVPGCAVSLAVTLLDDAQLARMDQTEGVPDHYKLERLSDRTLSLGNGETILEPEAYIGQQGTLWHEGGPVALAAMPHAGTPPPLRSEAEVQDLVRELLGEDMPLDDFVHGNIVDPSLRAARLNRLKSHFGRRIPFTGLLG